MSKVKVVKDDDSSISSLYSKKRIKEEYKRWMINSIRDIDINSFSNIRVGYSNSFNEELYTFTLLLKRNKKNNNGVGIEYGSRSKYSECLNIFRRKLEERVYGKNCRRKGIGFNVFIPFFENVLGDNQHYHIVISKPKCFSYKVLEKLIRELWIEDGKMRWSRFNDGNGVVDTWFHYKVGPKDSIFKGYDDEGKNKEYGWSRVLEYQHREEFDVGRFNGFLYRKEVVSKEEKGEKLWEKWEEDNKDYYRGICLKKDLEHVNTKCHKTWMKWVEELRSTVGGQRIIDYFEYDLNTRKSSGLDKDNRIGYKGEIGEGKRRYDEYRKNFQDNRRGSIEFKRFYYKDNGYSFIDYGLKKFKVDKIDVQNLVLGNSKGIECKKWNKV